VAELLERGFALANAVKTWRTSPLGMAVYRYGQDRKRAGTGKIAKLKRTPPIGF
jgi:hypothetical protein